MSFNSESIVFGSRAENSFTMSSRVKFLYLYMTEVNAILKSTGVTVLGLNSNCVELVLRSVGDQYVSEATVIHFRCSFE
jgi:hypothetical protein